MSAGFPTTPCEVPDGSYAEIVEAHLQHVQFLVHAHHGIGEPVSASELAVHSVAALATQHALAERVLQTRWATARDALTYWASLDDTAAAMGFDVDEVVFGLRAWAAGQFRERLMTRAQYDEVAALVDTAEQSAGDR